MNEKLKNRRKINLIKYFIIFLITTVIFLLGICLSNKLNSKRVVNVKNVEDTISINILSSEIQFALLKEASCKGINKKTILSNELKELVKKISFMERALGLQNEEVVNYPGAKPQGVLIYFE